MWAKSSLTNASLSSFAFCSVTGRRSDRVAERVEVCSPQQCWGSIRQPVVLRLLLLALCAKLLYLFSREAPQLPSANTHDMREAKRLWTIIAQCSAVLCEVVPLLRLVCGRIVQRGITLCANSFYAPASAADNRNQTNALLTPCLRLLYGSRPLRDCAKAPRAIDC